MKWKDLLRVMSVAVLCASFSASPAHSGEKKKDKEPSFSFRSFDGKEIKLSQFKGKPILLKFISSWWPECRQGVPVLAKIYEKANAKGVEFVGIFIKDTELKAKEFVAEYRFTFPAGLDSEAKLATEYKVSVHQLNFSSAGTATLLNGSAVLWRKMI